MNFPRAEAEKVDLTEVFCDVEVVEVEWTHEVMAERDGEVHRVVGGKYRDLDEAQTRAERLNSNRPDNPFVVVSRQSQPVEAWGA